MKTSQKLRPVVRVAHHQERNAARQLGDRMRHVELQQKQLDELLVYRADYAKSFAEATAKGLSVVQLRDYQLFLSRLDTAIDQQKQQLADSQKNCDTSKVSWQDASGRHKMIDKVVERRQQSEQQQQQGKEQREADDRTPSGSSDQ